MHNLQGVINEIAVEQAKIKEKINMNQDRYANKSNLFPMQNACISEHHTQAVEEEVQNLKHTIENI